MITICPTVLAADINQYNQQMHKIAHLGHRVQIDLTDSVFAPTETIKPHEAWWPAGFKADVHLMYKDPMSAARIIATHNPSMFIVHAESAGNFDEMLNFCHEHGIKLGLALLADTPITRIGDALFRVDHILVFSGDLGSFGGHADLSLLNKVADIKKLRPDLEVGWDGGVNLMNVAQLVTGGVDVLNVGGYIQTANDPQKAYNDLVRIAEETGTT
jgi:ribulose-phosphate 3-epimerase